MVQMPVESRAIGVQMQVRPGQYRARARCQRVPARALAAKADLGLLDRLFEIQRNVGWNSTGVWTNGPRQRFRTQSAPSHIGGHPERLWARW